MKRRPGAAAEAFVQEVKGRRSARVAEVRIISLASNISERWESVREVVSNGPSTQRERVEEWRCLSYLVALLPVNVRRR